MSKQTTEVPNLPGIYIFYMIGQNEEELRYIGSSGSVNQDGSFKSQLLRKRLNNKQNGVSRQVFFNDYFLEGDITQIRIDWYITFNSNIKDLPKYVEALLLQEYYNQYGHLPIWNKSF